MADQEQLWKHWEGPQSSDRPSDNKLCWYTGVCPAYTIGLPYKGDADQTWAEAEGQQYLVMVRSVFDPERTPRPAKMSDEPDRDRTPHLTIKKSNREDWYEPILADLREHGQSTMNAIGVRVADMTADILVGGKFEAALWDLVRSEQIAWTQHVPVHFDLVERIDFVRKDWHEE